MFWLIAAVVATIFNIYLGCYMLRKQHTDKVILSWLRQANEQGLSVQESENIVGKFLLFRHFFWPFYYKRSN